MGAVQSQAYHDPKGLRKLDPKRRKPANIPTSGPLAIPKRKQEIPEST